MIIAVNTRLLLKDRLEGIGWFMHENLRRITASHPEHQFLFLFDRKFDPEFIYNENVTPLVIQPPTRHPLLWYIWFQQRLPMILRKHKADIYVSPDGYMPLGLKIPCHISLHDINFFHRPQDLPWSSRTYYNHFFPRFANSAIRIATVSEYSKKDISSSYGVDPDKIDVVYNGVNEVYSPLDKEEISETREQLTGGTPYFVFIGSLHPRKNIPRLLMAFDEFRKQYGQAFKLVIVGEKMFKTEEIDTALENMSYKKDVMFAGRMSPEKFRLILGSSAGLTFVPLFEGFGIPLLEAMRCRVPIMASNVTSLPEIAGNSALYANPENIREISDRMIQLATRPELCEKLISEGNNRVSEFSWDKTADNYWASIQKILV